MCSEIAERAPISSIVLRSRASGRRTKNETRYKKKKKKKSENSVATKIGPNLHVLNEKKKRSETETININKLLYLAARGFMRRVCVHRTYVIIIINSMIFSWRFLAFRKLVWRGFIS